MAEFAAAQRTPYLEIVDGPRICHELLRPVEVRAGLVDHALVYDRLRISDALRCVDDPGHIAGISRLNGHLRIGMDTCCLVDGLLAAEIHLVLQAHLLRIFALNLLL